jgi:hypothetical protein
MKLRLRDIVSYQGKDYVVEGLLTYRLGGKVLRLCRVVDGSTVRWVEPLVDDSDDRMLILDEVTASTCPPRRPRASRTRARATCPSCGPGHGRGGRQGPRPLAGALRGLALPGRRRRLPADRALADRTVTLAASRSTRTWSTFSPPRKTERIRERCTKWCC